MIYQVYPRRFADGDGDGVGDLAGLLARLGTSPMADFGYDAIAFTEAAEPLLAFERAWQGERVRCLFNLGPAPLTTELWGQPRTLPGYGWQPCPRHQWRHSAR